jgi:hypothetical protein
MSNATELLRRALGFWDNPESDRFGTEAAKVFDEIRAFLAAEPEAEPVAWVQPNHLEKAQFMPFLCRVEPKQRDDFIPLYTRPEPARKPMTEEEINRELPFECSGIYFDGFKAGVRFAEKHHGIGDKP